MDELLTYIVLSLLVLGPIAIFRYSRLSMLNRTMKAVGYVWIIGLLFFGEPLFSLQEGPIWLLAISPGFAIVIWMKYKESGCDNDQSDYGGVEVI